VMLDVHLNDGRTVLRIESRQQLVGLLLRDPARLEQERCKRVWIDRGAGEGWQQVPMMYLRKATIGWIEQLAGEARNAFLTRYAPELLEEFNRRQAEREAADAAQASEAPAAA
jgi:hypothetical protein